jgi:hypothetical protein
LKAAAVAETELAMAIGRFSIEFSAMEDRLDCLIHELLGLEPDTGYALTSAIRNTSTRMEILRSLVEDATMAVKNKAALLSLLDTAAALNTYRNRLLHNAWSGSINSSRDPVWRHQKRRLQRSKNKRQWHVDSFTGADIEIETARCAGLEEELRKFVVQYTRRRAARKQKRK